MYKFRRPDDKLCKKCGSPFKPSKSRVKFCSIKCSNSFNGDLKRKYTCATNNTSRLKLENIKFVHHFDSCMIEGCNYNTTYDVHRLVPGKEGGKYEIGNMFAICPNHHAEITRKIIKVEKINDFTLRIVENVQRQKSKKPKNGQSKLV